MGKYRTLFKCTALPSFLFPMKTFCSAAPDWSHFEQVYLQALLWMLKEENRNSAHQELATSQEVHCPCSHWPLLYLATSLCQKSRSLTLWRCRPLPYCSLRPEAHFLLFLRASRKGWASLLLATRTFSRSLNSCELTWSFWPLLLLGPPRTGIVPSVCQVPRLHRKALSPRGVSNCPHVLTTQRVLS